MPNGSDFDFCHKLQCKLIICLISILAKDMKKKKQKQRLKDMEKRSSEKGMDLMEAYTEKPVQEEVNNIVNN